MAAEWVHHIDITMSSLLILSPIFQTQFITFLLWTDSLQMWIAHLYKHNIAWKFLTGNALFKRDAFYCESDSRSRNLRYESSLANIPSWDHQHVGDSKVQVRVTPTRLPPNIIPFPRKLHPQNTVMNMRVPPQRSSSFRSLVYPLLDFHPCTHCVAACQRKNASHRTGDDLLMTKVPERKAVFSEEKNFQQIWDICCAKLFIYLSVSVHLGQFCTCQFCKFINWGISWKQITFSPYKAIISSSGDKIAHNYTHVISTLCTLCHCHPGISSRDTEMSKKRTRLHLCCSYRALQSCMSSETHNIDQKDELTTTASVTKTRSVNNEIQTPPSL